MDSHERIVADLRIDRDKWKANHDNQVMLKRIISERPDLRDRALLVAKLITNRDKAVKLLQAHVTDCQSLKALHDEVCNILKGE